MYKVVEATFNKFYITNGNNYYMHDDGVVSYAPINKQCGELPYDLWSSREEADAVLARNRDDGSHKWVDGDVLISYSGRIAIKYLYLEDKHINLGSDGPYLVCIDTIMAKHFKSSISDLADVQRKLEDVRLLFNINEVQNDICTKMQSM